MVGSTSTLFNEMVADQSDTWRGPVRRTAATGPGSARPRLAEPVCEQSGHVCRCASCRTPAARAGRLQPQCWSCGSGCGCRRWAWPGVELKWPNDRVGKWPESGRHISSSCMAAVSGTEIVIGVGINFHLPESVKQAIDQPVTDLQASGQHLFFP